MNEKRKRNTSHALNFKSEVCLQNFVKYFGACHRMKLICIFAFISLVTSQTWRRVLKINQDVPLPSAPNLYFFDDSITTFDNINAENAYLSSEGESLWWQSTNFKSLIINDWKSNQLQVTKVRLSFTKNGIIQKSIQFSTSDIFNRGSWFVQNKLESSSWSDLATSWLWGESDWIGINTVSWKNGRTFTMFDPTHGNCQDEFYFLGMREDKILTNKIEIKIF